MAGSSDLIALIHQIRNATSPLHRLKLAALAWRSLRDLAPTDRLAVATAIGLEGAERLVEQLGSRGGVSPSLLLGAIQQAERAEPAELERILTGLQQPQERAALASEAAAELERWVVRAEPDLAAAPAPPAAGAADATVDSAAAPQPAAADTPLDAVTPPDAAAWPQIPPPAPDATHPPDRPPAAEVIAPVTATPRTTRRPTGAPATAVRRPPPPGKPTPRTARGGPASGGRHGDRPSTPSQPAPPRAAADPDLAAELRQTDATFARLRLLAERAHEAAALATPELARVVATFAAGWPRRRALETLIRAGAITSPDTLLELLAGSDPRTAAWVVSAFAACRELSPEALARLEAAAPPHPIPGRLTHRRARSA